MFNQCLSYKCTSYHVTRLLCVMHVVIQPIRGYPAKL